MPPSEAAVRPGARRQRRSASLMSWAVKGARSSRRLPVPQAFFRYRDFGEVLDITSGTLPSLEKQCPKFEPCAAYP
jgi:hypothetical protein